MIPPRLEQSTGPPITRPSTDQVQAWSRRRAPAVTLRHKGKCSEDAGAEGMGGAGRTIGECVEKPGATGSVRFCSLVAGRVRISPADFLIVADFLAHMCKLSERDA
jgi:hypothetical protein